MDREVGFIVDLAGKIEKSAAQINVTRGILQTMQTVGRTSQIMLRYSLCITSASVVKYYPEKLGFSLVQNLGIITKTLLNIIWPFVE